MSTGSTGTSSSSTLTGSGSSGGGVVVQNSGYFLPETFVDENGFHHPLNNNPSRIAGNTTTTLIR